MAKVGIIVTWDMSGEVIESRDRLKKMIKKDYENLDEFLEANIVEWETVEGVKIKSTC